MFVLAIVIINQFRAVQLRGAGDIGSAYIEGFLAPYAQEAHSRGGLSPASEAELSEVINHFSSDRGFDKLRIWSVDQELWFDSDHAATSEGHDEGDLADAISGNAVAVLEFPGEAGAGETTISHPYIEIYAPIFGSGSRDIMAIGEIYQDARPMLEERARFERKVWGAVGFATVGFIALMIVLSRQHRLLVLNIDHQRDIATQNQLLREAAETAWRSSGQAHEALLNHLGAELHDGPVQMLSLLALMGSRKAAGSDRTEPEVQDIAQNVLDDLRRISAGLILPELGQLSVRDTIMLAITRHANATGTDVSHEFDPLPDAADDLRKTCLYRIVQEGLNNAFRHGGGFGQRVTARVEDGTLHIAVVNKGSGPSEALELAAKARNTGLGVIGLRNRLKVFGGTLDAAEIDGGGFFLSAYLPLA
jgi:signal transduction histidine kinase